MNKKSIIIIAISVATFALVAFLALYITKLQYAHIDSFEKCIGDEPAIGIYGTTCTTPDGRVFIHGE